MLEYNSMVDVSIGPWFRFVGSFFYLIPWNGHFEVIIDFKYEGLPIDVFCLGS